MSPVMFHVKRRTDPLLPHCPMTLVTPAGICWESVDEEWMKCSQDCFT